ncbi:purine permease [Kluyveromyces marxianus DMKU3-1042]|uniref:Purine permease n=1 Tax=Kluyveromyces marxianus (strain DMKU3-1042 / BCC 29191 / NBRC 104275) TaxID=1003335 RepID=W0T691_KLUMD|nr:purine permease [Kluyveromyces marxianus DMKU3-1042]BAO38920.1 purine permease [Kluyveromyces marxianus DMKU3-1042]
MDQALQEAVEQENVPRESWKDTVQSIRKKWTTKEGLLGDYNYAFLFTPSYPFQDYIARKRGLEPVHRDQPFFSLNSDIPVVLGFILGLQHSLSMLAGVITPPILIAGVAKMDTKIQEYLVSVSLIVSGIMSAVQITRFHIPYTPYYIGSGVISVVGTSFATITLVNNVFPMMYNTGYCPVAADGTQLPCPDGYGALLGTSCVCALLEILIAFTPSSLLQKMFPKIVTGPVIVCIALSLIESGFQDWVGGSGCVDAICPSKGAPMAGEWGSARFIGLGFLVYTTIIIFEKYGAPIMRSCAVILGLLVGCIVAAACGYFDKTSIDAAPAGTFMWVHTFKLSVYGPAVLPMLVVYIVLATECIGDVTATCEVSRLEVEGAQYESRIQGAVLSDGLSGLLSGLCTITPMSTFAQNNGVISITKCASRQVGYWCCFFMIIMGIFAKFGAALVAIPKPVLGGMTTFLFTSVAVAGIKIISTTPFTRRDRFVLTCSLLPGIGATLVPTWFSKFFTYSGSNNTLQGFLNAIELIMESGFAVCAIVGIVLNQFLPQELDEELMDDVELQQENLSVFDERNDPEMISHILSSKAKEAEASESQNPQSYELKDSIRVTEEASSSDTERR